ncbi:MAG: hypothetical protein MR384_01625 [Lachnospiraceae bacterium]|nr:hypothetical protein [Lachnospiraceae bacterium]
MSIPVVAIGGINKDNINNPHVYSL